MDIDYMSDDENFIPLTKTKAAPKAAAKKAKEPLQLSTAANISKGRTIEQTYQKKTPLEHVLLRPDTYVGSVQSHTQTLWVYENGRMVHREATIVPGLYKIFDEILVNAADNKQRDPSMDLLKVNIDPEKNMIKVWNNGKGVPIEIHADENCYVPEMIFGHLLTSSNYDDTEKKTTGGRNGYGAKLANIFSTEFVIETADGDRKKQYRQVFNDNMSKKSEPEITKTRSGESWTCVTFHPDLAKFKLTHLDADHVALMSKRVVDMAGVLGKTVKVELNGSKIPMKNFQDYVGLYLDSSKSSGEVPGPLPKIYEKVNDNWEVCVSLSDGQFQQVSFVNSIATIKGGTHVNLVADQVTKFLIEKAQKKAGKGAPAIKAHQVKCHLWVFVNSMIVNPAFDSQTKETLNTRASEFGSTCKLPDSFLQKVAKSGVIDSILSFATFKANKDMKKSDGSKKQRLTGISKLDDANDAGGRNSEQCTLILTEGDSAKALAVSGLSVVGRDKYGVFPLRGKLLNVRDAPAKQLTENAEITNIKQIMGLQQGKHYDSTKSLRYGHLMIMTDQDHDGSHIKGLLINFLHAFWPSLLKQPNFLLEFITPIVKATGPRGKVISFYTIPEYESWKESLGGSTKGWSIKYYKGLGTSTPKEAKEYFAALDQHRKSFEWTGEEDGESIEMAFSKKKVEDRKTWLRNVEPGTFLDQSAKTITYSDFVNKELVLFSIADNLRSIPSVMDGLKPGQRKILFSCFKRKLKSDVKVAQLAGYISEHSAYHHGEMSLMTTIIGLAQDFVGSNNINLLVPSGQFGTRLQGGKDAASPRYIYTRLHKLTRILFSEVDDALLDFLNEDGQKIEPTWYLPILPLVLVNGSEGIGTGWSSYVPTFNPRDIVDNLKRLMKGEEMEPLHPWFRGFKGSVEHNSNKDGRNYIVTGTINKVSDTVLEITELPIRTWTQNYKEFLEGMMVVNDKNKEPFIKDMREHHTDTTVHFEVHLSPEGMATAEAEGLIKRFKLTASVATSNMHLFDKDGRMRKYETPEEIIEEFYHIRLEYYRKRKDIQLEQLRNELIKLDNRVRFILAVVRGEIIVSNRKKAELLAELKEKKFAPLPKSKVGSSGGSSTAADEEGDDEGEESGEEEGVSKAKGGDGGYDYLLGMPLWSLTLERVQELLRDQKKNQDDHDALLKTEPKELWESDLDMFLAELEVAEEEAAQDKAKEVAGKPGKGKGRVAKAVAVKPKRAQKKAQVFSDEEMDFISDSDDDFREDAKLRRGKGAAAAAAKPTAVAATTKPQAPVPLVQAPKPEVVKPAPKAKPAPKPKAPAGSDYDSDEDFGGSLKERLAAMAAKMSLQEKPSGGESTAEVKPAASKKEPAKKASTKRPATKKMEEKVEEPALGDQFEFLDDVDIKSPMKEPVSKVQRMRPSPFSKKSGLPAAEGRTHLSRGAQKKPAVVLSDDSDESEESEDDFQDFSEEEY
ncbi:unnamed protein product [Closterium sp. NIES-53]